MIKVIKKEIDMEESLKKRLEIICDFCNKSIKYSKKLEEQFIKRNFFKREPFIHKWNMKKEDDIFRIVCKYLYTQCDGYDNEMKKAKLNNYIEDLFLEEYYNIKQKVIEEMKKQLQIDCNSYANYK